MSTTNCNESKWISVKDKLPEENIKQVIVWDAEERTMHNCEMPQGWNGLLKHEYITHWMPLPKPPVN